MNDSSQIKPRLGSMSNSQIIDPQLKKSIRITGSKRLSHLGQYNLGLTPAHKKPLRSPNAGYISRVSSNMTSNLKQLRNISDDASLRRY